MEIVYVSLAIIIITYMNYLHRRLNRNIFELERKFNTFETHFKETSTSMEKKIRQSSSDVEKVRRSFKSFQTNFLEMETLIKQTGTLTQARAWRRSRRYSQTTPV